MRGTVTLGLALLLLAAAPVPAQESLTGWLTVEWGDPEPGVQAPAVLQYQLTTEDGLTSQLFILEEILAAAGGLLAVQNRRVTVDLLDSQPGDAALLPAGVDRIVSAIRLAPDAKATGAPSAAPSPGSNPWITLPCRFSDVAAEPKNQAYFQAQYGSNPGELNHFWKAESYNIINIDGSTAQNWVSLPSPRATYVPAEDACLNPGLPNADLQKLFEDCVAVHDAAVNFAPFFGINMAFNDDLDGCAWGGTRFATLDGVTKVWPVTWEPPFGFVNNSVFEHENGHGYGLPHSNNWDNDGSPYDNEWDYMSGGSFSPGSNPYGSWGTGGMAWHKELLGWLAPGEVVVVSAGVQTIDLDPLGAATASNKRMIKIPLGANQWWTIEARQKTGTYETGLPGTAVLISEIDTGGRFETIWVYDASVPPANFNNNEGTMWKVGETFTDAANGVTVEVLQTIASGGFRVRVTTPGGCAEDAFEPDDGSGQAKGIAPGTPKSHNICPVGDDDWSTFTLSAQSNVVLETSGGSATDDTRMWLRGSNGTTLIEFDDDDGANLYSRIDRVCGVDPLPVGTYFVEVDELNDDALIDGYSLELSAAPCVDCAVNVVLSNDTLTGTQYHAASNTATLGPALVVNGTDIQVHATQRVVFKNGTTISGSFRASNSPACNP